MMLTTIAMMKSYHLLSYTMLTMTAIMMMIATTTIMLNYDSDNDDDSDGDDDDDKDDVKDNDDDDEGLPGLTTRGDDSDSDDNSDDDEEEPLPDSGSKKNKQRNEEQQKKEPPKDADCQEDDEGETIEPKKIPGPKRKKKIQSSCDSNILDSRRRKKKRRLSKLQRPSAKVTRSPRILTPSQQRGIGMKTRGKKLSYSHRYTMIIHHVLTHYSIKAGIKKFGTVGTITVSDEPQQLHMKDTFTPMKITALSPEQKKRVLHSLMFVKKKLDGKIKGRACTDGRKQRNLYAKEDASSPTVSIETVLLTSVIDVLENRDVTVTDISGAYLTTDIDEEVHMNLEGKLAEIMVLIVPEVYRTYITTSKNGQPTLYVKFNKHCMDVFAVLCYFGRN